MLYTYSFKTGHFCCAQHVILVLNRIRKELVNEHWPSVTLRFLMKWLMAFSYIYMYTYHKEGVFFFLDFFILIIRNGIKERKKRSRNYYYITFPFKNSSFINMCQDQQEKVLTIEIDSTISCIFVPWPVVNNLVMITRLRWWHKRLLSCL